MIDIHTIHTIIFDFDGVFTDNKVLVAEDGSEAVVCSRADGLGLDLLRAFVASCGWTGSYFILSKETNPVVLKRASKLKLECKVSIKNKLEFVNKYFSENLPFNSEPFSGLVFIGNDLNDLPVMFNSTKILSSILSLRRTHLREPALRLPQLSQPQNPNERANKAKKHSHFRKKLG